MEKLARREQTLKAKCELQEGRLTSNGKSRVQDSGLRGRQIGTGFGPGSGSASGGNANANAAGKAAELRRLVQKKERLKYAVERLELESTQKKRQLRMSMAAQ